MAHRRKKKKKETWRDVPSVPTYEKPESDSWTERSFGENSGYDLRFGSSAKYKKRWTRK